MVRVKIYSYNNGEGSKNLSKVSGYSRLKHQGSTYRPGETDLIINWGSSRMPDLSPARVLNPTSRIRDAADKLVFFGMMPEDIVPEWTSDREKASVWLTEGHTVVCRHKLVGHSGEGIELVSDPLCELPEAPLYTKYFKKQAEYRVHIFGGEVIDVQQKKRKTDVPDEEVNWKIRNLAGGFIYAREGVVPPEGVIDVAKTAHGSSGLDFGAYDVLWNSSLNKAVVLEVNTAPGITGTTVQKYADAIKKITEE